jgi:peptidyl-prolyl cis-trans isomerase D
VQIPIAPSEQDLMVANDRAAGVLEQARDGEDFAELATLYSEGPSAPNGGDLGTFTEGQMVAEFSEAAFALEPGGVSGLVETTFGIHIIKVEEKSTSDSGKPQVHARHILFKTTTSDETIDHLFSQAKSIVSESAEEDGSFESAAEAAGYQVVSSNLFGADVRFLPGLGSVIDIVPVAFTMEVGDMAKPVRIGDTSFVVFRMDEEQPAHVQPFDDVKDTIEAQLKRERAGELIEPRIREIAGKIKSLDELEQIESEMAKNVKTSQPFSRTGTVPGVGRSPEFIDAAFTLAEGVLSDPIIVSAPRVAALLEVVGRTEAAMDELAAQKDAIKQTLLQAKQTKLVADWQKSLRERAVIAIPNKDFAATLEAPAAITASVG